LLVLKRSRSLRDSRIEFVLKSWVREKRKERKKLRLRITYTHLRLLASISGKVSFLAFKASYGAIPVSSGIGCLYVQYRMQADKGYCISISSCKIAARCLTEISHPQALKNSRRFTIISRILSITI